MSFDDVKFSDAVSRGATIGNSRPSEIVSFRSGREHRNYPTRVFKRRFNVGYGMRDLDDLYDVYTFFIQRGGSEKSFRFKDWSDYKSGSPNSVVASSDQTIGDGDGTQTAFQIVKNYGSFQRTITKIVAGTDKVAVNGVDQVRGSDYTIVNTTGVITFSTAPTAGHSVTCGFEFDVPVRFDGDDLDVNVEHFKAGQIPNVILIEVIGE